MRWHRVATYVATAKAMTNIRSNKYSSDSAKNCYKVPTPVTTAAARWTGVYARGPAQLCLICAAHCRRRLARLFKVDLLISAPFSASTVGIPSRLKILLFMLGAVASIGSAPSARSSDSALSTSANALSRSSFGRCL
eukprot:5262219-Pleurochrysis_carterae.AAC.1